MEKLPAEDRWTPSALAAVFVLLLAVVIGTPIYVRMPPWPDLTLYQEAAANLLAGGVHYRDVFDTNLPGFVWIVTAIRAVFGGGSTPARAIDLVVVAGIAAVLAAWLRRCGASRAAALWCCAGIALLYPFTYEFCHVQRDTWMLLPAAVACSLASRGGGRCGFAIGLLWGAAVWIKPHVVVPAAMVFFVPNLGESRKAYALFRGKIFLGGVVAGAAGIAWLINSGSWPYFVEVFTEWNPDYTQRTLSELPERVNYVLCWFSIWSLWHAVAIPAAIWAIAATWRKRDDDSLRNRAVLSLLYLGWMLQAFVLQRGMDYVHVPETFLMLAVLASFRISATPIVFGWLCLLGVVWQVFPATMRKHAPDDRMISCEQPRMFSAEVYRHWTTAVNGPATPQLMDDLAMMDVHCQARFAELDRVADFLRTVEPPLRDGELLAFHDSPHPIHQLLHLKPATRFLHFGTVLDIRTQKERIGDEVRAAKPRYVVADVMRMTWPEGNPRDLAKSGEYLALPAWFPMSWRDRFPWNQSPRFRCGRYYVYEVTKEIGDVDIPTWRSLGSLGPGEP